MLHLLQMGPFKVLTTLLFQIQNSWQLSLLELFPAASLLLLEITLWLPPSTSSICISPLFNLVPSAKAAPPPTLAFKPFIPLRPILYLLPLLPHHRLFLLAVCLHLQLPLSPLTPSWFFNGMLVVSEPGALTFYTFFRPIPFTLFASRNPILTPFSFLKSLGFLLCVLIASTPTSHILSSDATHAGGGVIIFSRQGLSISDLSNSSLSSLDI